MFTTGLVYVVLVIIEFTQLRIPVWKESARPIVFHEFNNGTQRLLRGEVSSKGGGTAVRYD
jgi:hypothetical protein